MKSAEFLFLFAVPMTLLAVDNNLNIVIVDGEAAIHNLRKPSASQIVVRVEREGKPAVGATVALSLPSQGASGTFANRAITTTAMADSEGVAAIKGLKPNSVAGKLQIRVTASYEGQTAHASITQFNIDVPTAERKSGNSKIIIILAAAGAAAAGGAYLGLHKSTSTATPTTAAPVPSITITAGSSSVGAP
jgi:hypothetical protein